MDVKDSKSSSIYDREYFEAGTKSSYASYSFSDDFIQQVEDLQNLLSPESVLDVGSAKGFLVSALHQKNILAYGIEISHYANQNLDKLASSYCIEGDVVNLPIKTSSFDVTVCYDILEHIPNEFTDKLLDEICRVTKNLIIVRCPYVKESWDKDITHVNIQPSEYWIEKFQNRDFILLDTWLHSNERPTWYSLIFYHKDMNKQRLKKISN